MKKKSKKQSEVIVMLLCKKQKLMLACFYWNTLYICLIFFTVRASNTQQHTARQVNKFYKIRMSLRPRRSRRLAIESKACKVLTFLAVYYIFFTPATYIQRIYESIFKCIISDSLNSLFGIYLIHNIDDVKGYVVTAIVGCW